MLPNLAGLSILADHSGFLAGLLTWSNVVAAVLGADRIPPVVAYKEGWESGALRHIEPGIAELVTAVHNNGFSGGNTIGPVGLAPFHDFDSVVTTEMRDTLDAVAAGLKNGSITPGMSCLDWPLPPTVGNRGDDRGHGQAMA